MELIVILLQWDINFNFFSVPHWLFGVPLLVVLMNICTCIMSTLSIGLKKHYTVKATCNGFVVYLQQLAYFLPYWASRMQEVPENRNGNDSF